MKTKQINQSGIEWKEIALGEIGKIFAGGDVPKNSLSKISTQKYDIPIFTNGEKDDGLYGYTNTWKVSKPSITISARGTIGYPKIRKIRFYPAIRLIVLTPYKDIFDLNFLKYAINRIKFNSIQGTSIPQLTVPIFKRIKVSIPFGNGHPDLETQQRIVSILEKAQKLKERGKKAKELLDEYLKSVFNEMFGDPVNNEKKWPAIEAQELFDMKLGKMLSAKNYTGANLRPYLRNINVQWNRLDLSDIKKMDFNDKEFIIYKLKRGDILVCEGGEVGRTAIYQEEIENCCYQNALHRLRVKDNSIISQYFVYFMMLAVKAGLIKSETIQVTIAHFTANKFRKLKIPLPPIALQQTFASIVNHVGKMKENVGKMNVNSAEMFDSLMHKAFRGGLLMEALETKKLK